jgi:hypothetical protein
MNIRHSIRPGRLAFSVALFASSLAVALYSAAQSTSQTSSKEKIEVVGHLELQGMHVKRIIVQQRDGQYYLYLHRANKNAFAIVDVTDPNKPVLIDRAALQEPAGGSVELPAPGSVFGLAFAPDKGQSSMPDSSATLPTESVRLKDLTDPKHPKIVKTFDGVTSVTTDDGRKLVFIVNNEGLWIVKHYQKRPLPVCTSDADSAAFPQCQ